MKNLADSMVRSVQRLFWLAAGTAFGLAIGVSPLMGADAETELLKSKAYQLYEQKRFDEAARQFQSYLDKSPQDTQASLDYASLLSQLTRHDQAARLLEAIHEKNPTHEPAYFKLGAEYVALKRYDEAEKIFSALEKSANRDLANAAVEASRRLKADLVREERMKAEQNVFGLAENFQHPEVVAAVNQLETQGPLSFGMEMQRLYSLHALQEYAPALERADRLAVTYPGATDLALVRAELLAQLGRRAEATAIWRQIERENAGTAAATEARHRREASTRLEAEDKIYELARQQKHREIVAAVGDLEKTGDLSFSMELQRLYAWQSLGQNKLALDRANELAGRYSNKSELHLLRADLLTQQNRWDDASILLRQISREYAGTLAAFEAEKRLRAEMARQTRNRAEERIFNPARQKRHQEVVAAIDDLEQKGELPWLFEMQRLYALQAGGETARAQARSDELAESHPQAADLKLFRAYLLAQAGNKDEATKLLRQVEQEYAGTPVAAEAAKQVQAFAMAAAEPTAEDKIYEFAGHQQYRETVAAIDDLERQAPLALRLGMQRLYALQALGETSRAIEEAGKLAAAYPQSTEPALVTADLLVREQKWEEASEILKQVKYDHLDTPVAAEAQRRLDVLPPMANLDKWYWGEAYLSGDYHGRFGTVIGSGFARHGTYLPGARWLQPFQEFQFSVDTSSGVGGQRSIIADNFVGFYHGLRLQPFTTEYFFFYAKGGINNDLLGRRHNGDWALDYAVGLYGFRSWGPGTVLHTAGPEEEIATTGNVPAATPAAPAAGQEKKGDALFWRGDWFTDVAADFSYYHRYRSWIGYGQAHQGFRVFQLGPHLAFDMYAVQNISWDIRGDYFDNLVELGPGARWLWVPHRGWEIVLRGEWLKGYYLGRNEANTRGGHSAQYDNVHVGLSVGLRW